MILTRVLVDFIPQSGAFFQALDIRDLTAAVDVTQKDEIGLLTKALPGMKDKIDDVLQETRALTGTGAHYADEFEKFRTRTPQIGERHYECRSCSRIRA